jgi:hypothetical protein
MAGIKKARRAKEKAEADAKAKGQQYKTRDMQPAATPAVSPFVMTTGNVPVPPKGSER